MKKPQRIQLRRTKGFNLQAVSMALNGLPAVKVDRTTAFGNPFRIGSNQNPFLITVESPEHSVELFREWVDGSTAGRELKRRFVAEHRNANPACWCAPGKVCHADVLLELEGK